MQVCTSHTLRTSKLRLLYLRRPKLFFNHSHLQVRVSPFYSFPFVLAVPPLCILVHRNYRVFLALFITIEEMWKN